MSNIDNNLIEQLKNNIDGAVVLPQDSNYDEVRTIWNAMIDRKPAVIVQCASDLMRQRPLHLPVRMVLNFQYAVPDIILPVIH